MLELQERPAAEKSSPAGERPGRPVQAGGLGKVARTDESRPRVRTTRTGLWSRSQQRRLAGANLVTVVILIVTGVGAATGFQPLEAPAAVGRAIASVLGLAGPSDATMNKRPPVQDLLPYGKGMWLYEPDKTEGGNVAAIVAKAKAAGLSHLYVRTGSSWNGFYAGDFLDKILPAAHEADLMVYGWDFPRLIDVGADVRRAKAAIDHRAPGRPADAAELAAIARPLAAHVNLIPLNPTPGFLTRGTPAAGVRAFRDRLVAAGVNATIRRNRGTDIAAACGQLAAGGQPPLA